MKGESPFLRVNEIIKCVDYDRILLGFTLIFLNKKYFKHHLYYYIPNSKKYPMALNARNILVFKKHLWARNHRKDKYNRS
jgi:hypothetical protein